MVRFIDESMQASLPNIRGARSQLVKIVTRPQRT